jgi:N-acetylglucosamine repressor
VRVQHAKDVMIGRDQQGGRLGERSIVREETGVDVTMRTHEWKASRLLVKGTRQTPDRWIRVEVAVLVQDEARPRGMWRGAGPVRCYAHRDVSHVSTSRRPVLALTLPARQGGDCVITPVERFCSHREQNRPFKVFPLVRKINTLSFSRATRSTSREINRRIALNLVREHEPISRAELARQMKIGRGVVTALVGELIAEGAVYEGATVDAPRGRKPTMLYVRTRDRLVIAIDVRLSRTSLMLTDFAGTELALESFETRFSPADLVDELASRVRRLLGANEERGPRNEEVGLMRSNPVKTAPHPRVPARKDSQVVGIGLVVPGMVDRQTGRVLHAPQLGWRDVDIRDALSDATGLPVHIENAPIACALAKMWLGGALAGTDFAYVTVSDGVGVGIVVDGQVVRGHHSAAGEFGHVPLDVNGPRCLCGSRGCWEVYTSNVATIARYLGRTVAPASTRKLLQSMPMTMPELIARARAGEERAIAALLETGRYLGSGLATVIAALNPARIFVGGEITEAWDLIDAAVQTAVRERALTDAASETPIIPEGVNERPRLRGAAALVAAPTFAAPQVA